jgi:hypothetical protein
MPHSPIGTAEAPVLSAADRRHFRDRGYVVVKEAVPRENVNAVVDLIWEFLEMDRNDPAGWYRPPLAPGGMVEVYQHQALWNNRQHPRIHQAFRELFGSERLWVSFDRANLKPPRSPAHPEYDHPGFIHWDVDTRKLSTIPFGVQGVLYLTDTTEDMGGFQCVPGMHQNLEEWIKSQPKGRNPRVPDITGWTVVPIPGRAGDFVIWDRLLPHGNGRNVSQKPRLAQYITMFPAAEADEAYRQRRIRMWRHRLPPRGRAFPGDPRKWERRNFGPAILTDLGQKLLGLEPWGLDEPRSLLSLDGSQ